MHEPELVPPTPLHRPTHVRVDAAQCVRCGLCDALLPGVRTGPQRVPVSAAALEAMATCPTGAIVWCEEGPLRRRGEATH